MLLRVLCLLLTVYYARCQQSPPSEVAFSAGLTAKVDVSAGSLVVFNSVFVNIGEGYSSTTGKFICHQSGIYVFQVHALAQSNNDMLLQLLHNSQYIMSLWGYTENSFAAGGNSVILEVTAGDEVEVKAVNGYNSELYGTSGEVYCTFNGYLISPIYNEIPAVG